MKKRKRKKNIIWVLLFLIMAFVLVYYFDNSYWIKRKLYPLKFEYGIQKYAEEYSLDPFLVASVILVESRYIPDSISPKEAKGLMQILPSTGEWIAERMDLKDYQEEQLFDPEINIRIGCWYLSFLSSQFPDNTELVLASYNAGIGNVNKWLANKKYSSDGKQLDYIPFLETRNYVSKVQDAYEIYKKIYPFLNQQNN